MEPTLDFIKTLTAEAGQIIQGVVGDEMDVQHKSPTDLVTRADKASEAFLIDAIRKAFPEHAINAEESGAWQGSAEHQWFIDPLDGTLNFAHGVPIYCVSVGYAYRGEMALGVVYNPVLKEFFCAERGAGATLNDAKINVSGYTDLVDCMLATGFPSDDWGTPQDNMANYFRFNQLSQTVRRLGSAALDIVYVAAGRLDGFWSISIHQWDVAAGALIVQEAGGVVTDVFGGSDFMRQPVTIACANPVIHAKMLAVLAEVRESLS